MMCKDEFFAIIFAMGTFVKICSFFLFSDNPKVFYFPIKYGRIAADMAYAGACMGCRAMAQGGPGRMPAYFLS